MPNSILHTSRPARRPKMSVRRPLIGCVAAVATRKEVPSHERVLSEEKESEIGAESVATMVESGIGVS